jgi:hypothetical protein
MKKLLLDPFEPYFKIIIAYFGCGQQAILEIVLNLQEIEAT